MPADAAGGLVLVAGSINTDLVVRVPRAPAAGETVTGDRFDIFGGGKGANQALAAARSGARTAMLGAVGEDEFGRQRLDDLMAEKVDCSGVATITGVSSGVALIIVEESGQNRIAYIPGATGAIEADQAIATFDAVNPTVVLTTLELPNDAVDALIKRAQRARVPVVVNATPEPAMAKDLALQADVLIVNQSEASALLDDQNERGDWIDTATRLRRLGPTSVIITLGADGALLVDNSGPLKVPAPIVTAVDTTGAGDALCGAVAGQLAAGAALSQAVKVGVAAGAVAVTKPGAQPSMPMRDEVEAMLRTMRRA